MAERLFKTFLPLANGQTDIRRFSLPSSDLDFSAVKSRIAENYELEPTAFKVLWKDDDGDAVTIATTEDFSAILKKGQETIKFNIQRIVGGAGATPMEGTAQPENNQPPVDPDLHVGVSCDGCNNAVRCIRYKCLQCPDFDLCAECEGKALHNDHLLLKIPKPNMPNVRPIIFLAQTLRQAEEMASQGKDYCHTAMGSMPNPNDYMDLNAMGSQLVNVLRSMGIDASHFVQNPHGHGGASSQSRWSGGGCGGCGANSAAANAALDRRINETMEHLRAMGFQDDNGSLTNLVRSKKGDLFAVLDILKAQQANN